MRIGIALIVGICGVIAAAAVSARQDKPDRTWLHDVRKPPTADGRGIASLPYAQGRTFPTLDAYLVYLRDYAAPMDRPWYREVRPGLYRLETGNLRADAAPRLHTRDELERRFGFRQ